MVSERLRKLFALSIPLFILHGVEEYLTGFYVFDPLLFSHLGNNAQVPYIISQITLVLIALFIYKFILTKNVGLSIAILWGFLLIFELEHSYRAITLGRYTSGLISSLLLVLLGFFYWKELLKNWSNK